MTIDHEAFVAWVSERFSGYQVSDDEIKINSVFVPDEGNHLWCNTEKNCYHCWKSDEGGTLADLVAKVDKCSHEEARRVLGADNYVRSLESKLAKLLAKPVAPPEPQKPKLALPPAAYRVDRLTSPFRERALKYLDGRKLTPGDLMYCISGEFVHRLVIPYFGRDGGLIYWNARDTTGRSKLRYRGPDKDEAAVGKGDVLWMSRWPADGEKVYLTEGEFDAMSLAQCGLNAGACGGKEVGDRQKVMLRPYHVVISFDNDKSGKNALNKVGSALLADGVRRVSFIRPPVSFKDWNQMLVEVGAEKMKAYIAAGEKVFDPWTANLLRIRSRE